MNTTGLAERLAAALAPLPADTKVALAKMLRKQLPAAPKAAALLLDTRIDAELWLAGEDTGERNRALRRAPKGLYRRIVVTLADGFSVTAGSYLADDAAAKAEVVRCARARAMESVFAATDPGTGAASRMVEAYRNPGNGWQWVTLPDGSQRRTRACAVAPVATVEFVPLAVPAVEPVPVPVAEPEPADASRTAAHARQASPALAGPATSGKRAKRAHGAQAATVVPIRRASRSAYAVHNAAGFVLFVGPRRSAYTLRDSYRRHGRGWGPEGEAFTTRLPAGWRTAADLSPLVANAQAKVAGERQRVVLKLMA